MGKNIENPKPTISSPKKATNIPVVTFKWDFRTPPPPSPTSEGPSLACAAR